MVKNIMADNGWSDVLNNEINESIEIIGDDSVDCLIKLFEQLTGQPPQVDKLRFRSEMGSSLDLVDSLEHSAQLIKLDNNYKYYRISPYAFPIIRTDRSEYLIDLMCQLYDLFRQIYKDRLIEPIKIDEILDAITKPKADVLEALYYMSETHGTWSGKSNNFPYGEDSTICISESVIRKNSFRDVLTDYYRWHVINPQKNLSSNSIDNLFNVQEASGDRFFSQSDLGAYPEWFDELGDAEKSLIVEIDKALQNGLTALPVMGIRALLETLMLSRIEDKHSFKRNIKEFANQGYVTKEHAMLLEGVIDAGSAAIHRANIPSESEVRTCIEVVKHLMHGLYVLAPKVDDLERNTPSRKQQ